MDETITVGKKEQVLADGTRALLVYEAESDELNIYFGENRKATGVQLSDHILLRLDRAEGKAVSLSLIDFSLLTPQAEQPPIPIGLVAEIQMPDPVRAYCRTKGYAAHVVQGGMPYLVESWERVVESVVSGEVQFQDDYLNDMDGRRILEEALAVASPKQKAQFSERIAAADQRFLAVAVPTKECIWGDENAVKHRWKREKQWWYFHRPPNVEHEWRTY